MTNPSQDTAVLHNFEAIKARNKATWEAGDFSQIAPTLEGVAEEFMGRLPLRPGARVLDVACGTGNLAVIAARRGCLVSGVDLAGKLIEQARARADVEGLRIDWEEADAEALPCAGCQFDGVVSMFGVMFAPRSKVVVSELRRVTRPGGYVALANWTPAGFMGRMFDLFAACQPPPPAGLPSPLLWGDEGAVARRLRDGFISLRCTPRLARLRYPFPPADTVAFFRRYDGLTRRAFESLDASGQEALQRGLVALHAAHNVAGNDDTTEVEAEYLEVVAERG